MASRKNMPSGNYAKYKPAIKDARQRSGLADIQVADHLGITVQAYRNYEDNERRGSPDPETYIKLAKLFERHGGAITNIKPVISIEVEDQTLPSRLREMRLAFGFTQRELAALIGVGNGNDVSSVETSKKAKPAVIKALSEWVTEAEAEHQQIASEPVPSTNEHYHLPNAGIDYDKLADLIAMRLQNK